MTAAELGRGIFAGNPVFRVALGVCPALAVTATVKQSLAMSALVVGVLAASGITVSLARNLIPQRVRVPCHILVVAAFASIADILLSVRAPHASAVLGIYVPLVAVNCLILSRMQNFAVKNRPLSSLSDGILTGAGFAAALLGCAVIREFLGNYSILGQQVFPGRQPLLAMTNACGAFFSLAFVLAIFNYAVSQKTKRKETKAS